METHILTRMMIVFVLAVSPVTSHAASFNISWEGANDYRMTGQFSFSDSLINTGLINALDLDSFTVSGFLDRTLLGSFQLDLNQTLINFNFDTNSGTFITGGRSDSPSGQGWNIPNSNGGFGFFSGNSFQGFQINGELIAESQIRIGAPVNIPGIVPSTLEATPVPLTEVPEPSTFVLLGTGLIGLLTTWWWRKKKEVMFQS